MSKAALLLDWDNLLGRLVQDPWWVEDPAPLIQRIVDAVQRRSETLQPATPLQYKGYFLPSDRNVSAVAGRALTQLGFQRVDSTNAKNAADTRLIVKAARLQREGFTRFFILTGDEDFADLAIELEFEGAEAFIWPVDRTGLRGPIQDWHRKDYVAEAIGLEHGTPPTADELDQFVLYIQRLIDDGRHLGDWQITLRMIAERFGFTDVGKCEVLWEEVRDAGYIWEGREQVGGQLRRRRRIKYEHPRIKRLLDAVDLALDEVDRNHGSCDLGKLTGAVPIEHRERFSALPQMLAAGHYLTIAGTSVSFASRTAALGCLRPIKRIVLSDWHQSLVNPGREGVSPRVLAKRWVRHATRGARNVKPEIEERALQEGREVIERGKAAGALLPVGGKGAPYGYVLNEQHPLVSEVKDAATFIVALLPADGSTVDRSTLDEQLKGATANGVAIGATPSDRRFWLGALASEQVIRMFEGKVARHGNSRLPA